MVMGRGSVIGEAITSDPRVNAVSFTGSVNTGRRVAANAIAGMKKVQMEMGGKNPMVVMNDADLDVAVQACLNGAFFSTGQRCTASSRLIVEAGIHDDFVTALVDEMKQLVVGNALHADTQIGPVVSASQLKQNLGYVDIAKADGAEVVGGEAITLETEGILSTPGSVPERAQRHALFAGRDFWSVCVGHQSRRL